MKMTISKYAVTSLTVMMMSGATLSHADVKAEAPAQEKDWSVEAGFTVFSEYIFRGVDLSGNDIMLNPTLTVGWKGVSAYYWGAYSDSDSGGNGWYEEADLGVDYTFKLLDDKLSLTGGVLWYLFPDGLSGPDTVELYAIASYDCLLQPTVSLYYDIDEFHGGYLTFGISHSFDVGSKIGLKEGMSLSIDPSAALSIDLGYNSRASSSDVQFNDLLLGVAVPLQITENVSVHAAVQLSIAMDSLNDIGQGNELIGSVGATVSF